MPALENLAVAGFSVTALALALVALRAWRRVRNVKVLLLVIAFTLFVAKGVVYSYALFTTPDWAQRAALPGLILDVSALLLLYASVLAPSPR